MNHQNLYCKCAIFQCNQCLYKAEIYSEDEWIEKTLDFRCSTCQKTNVLHFGPPVIYRSDIDENVRLHFQAAEIPKQYTSCLECAGKTELHWTEILVPCPKCKMKLSDNSMHFISYTNGIDLDEFYQISIKKKKQKNTYIMYYNENGHLLYSLRSE